MSQKDGRPDALKMIALNGHIPPRWSKRAGSKHYDRLARTIALGLLLGFLIACRHLPPAPVANVETEVRAVLEKQAREWNAGNLAGFMETYAPGEATRFASGGSVTRGWQTVFDRYRGNYNTRAKMGALTFSDLEVTVVGPDTAIAFGRFHLKREADAPTGLFTLTLRRLPPGWRIIQDHTSAEAKQP